MTERENRQFAEIVELSFEDAVAAYSQVEVDIQKLQRKYSSPLYFWRKNLSKDDLTKVAQTFGVLLPLTINESVQKQALGESGEVGAKPLLFKITDLQMQTLLFAARFNNSGVTLITTHVAKNSGASFLPDAHDLFGDAVEEGLNNVLSLDSLTGIKIVKKSGYTLVRSAVTNYVGKLYLERYGASEGYSSIKFIRGSEEVIVGSEVGMYGKPLDWVKEVAWANGKLKPGLVPEDVRKRAGLILRCERVMGALDGAIAKLG